ncbi:hypothetical protein [Cellulosimicrobium cellulans]|uniref:hypothetical protein n=1 Tax=Cellulosimicrobium cellulans TaxID=1710 RepID=UPI002096CB13|nr:hypothetical protein [Cellulosimicrobium cellulans]MCO7273341.1 hypothetical protein [Cellulosimicrobium cellulans]
MDKRVKQVRSALRRMEQEGLAIVGDHLDLLQEDALSAQAGAPSYKPPRLPEPTFDLPGDFINKGWVHVLEDTEILLLLMVACGAGRLADVSPEIAIPSRTRLLNYGITRDSYSTAHHALSDFGLLQVDDVGRYDDGRVIDYGTEDGQLQVHRLTLRPDGFARDAYPVVRDALQVRLAI